MNGIFFRQTELKLVLSTRQRRQEWLGIDPAISRTAVVAADQSTRAASQLAVDIDPMTSYFVCIRSNIFMKRNSCGAFLTLT